MFNEPTERRAADKVIARSEGCFDQARKLATPDDEVAIALSPDPRRWPANGDGFLNPHLSAVYVMHAPTIGLCKIGYTSDLRVRLKMLNGNSPVPVALAHFVYLVGKPIAKLVEAEAQLALIEKSVRGEWFDVTVEEGAEAIASSVEGRQLKWWSEYSRRELGHLAHKVHCRDLQRFAA